MNMMVNSDLDLRAEQAVDADAKGQETALARMMKAWESKQAKNVRKVGGLGLMAVSLAACGSDGDGDSDDDDDGDGDIIGQIFNLTTDVDTFEGAEGDDTFEAGLGVGIDGLVGVQTLQEADVLVGGEGEDTLNATLNGTGAGSTFAAPSITDIEILNLTSAGSVLFNILPVGLDLSNSTGYTQIWNIGSNNDLNVVGVGESAAIGLDDVRGGTEYFVEYTSSADTMVQNVLANAVGTSEITGQADLNIDAPNGIETLNLAVSNIVRLNLEGDAAGMSVFNITGTGVTELSGEGNFGNLEALDSTGYTGDLTLDVNGSTVLTSVATNGGDDFINVNTAAVDGDLAVDLGAGDDILSLDKAPFYASMGEGEINALDFTGGVTGVETLSFEDTVNLNGDATLNMDGISDDLQVLQFTDGGIDGNGYDLTLANSPVEDLTIDSTMIDWLYLDAGNVVNLTVNATAENAELDLDGLAGGSLETLVVNQTTGEFGELKLNIDSAADNDVSNLQTIAATAAGSADVDIDADDADADMNALTTVSVIAGDDAELEMDGVPARSQEQEFVVTYDSVSGGGANFSFDLLLPDGSTLTLDRADFADQPTLDTALAGSGYTSTGLNTSAGQFSFTLVSDEPAATSAIAVTNFSSTGLVNVDNSTTVTQDGVAPESFLGMETIVVSGGEQADVNLDDVHGMFTLDVTAEGVGENGDDADVDVDNSNVTSVNVTVSDAVVYEFTAGDITGYVEEETGEADISINDSANFNQPGNPLLTDVTASGAIVDLELGGDLSSLMTIDLTGVGVEFDVDASLAEFDPAAGDYVTYLVGSTSSDWEEGDSSIDMADARETVTFTEADFGTVVLNDFTAGDDPVTGDRIDLSQLGFTNNGQVTFEVGQYDETTGEWAAGGDMSDVRITDLAGGPEMSGEIIVTTDGGDGNALSDDLSQYNMTYA